MSIEWMVLAVAVLVLVTIETIRWRRSDDRRRAMVFINGVLCVSPDDYGWDFAEDPLPVFQFKIKTEGVPDQMAIVWPGGRRDHYVAIPDEVAGFIWITRDEYNHGSYARRGKPRKGRRRR